MLPLKSLLDPHARIYDDVDAMKLDPELECAFNEGNLITCVGPALSIAAGVPGLAALTKALLDHALAIDPRLDGASLREWIATGRATEVLEQLHYRLGDEFQREVERRLSDQGRSLPPEVTALAKLRKQLRAIYTMGLDRLIERGLAGHWPSFSVARPDIAQRRNVLFKLRGTLEFPRGWVLTREQEQREFGPGSACRTILEAAFRAHHLLVIGFAVDDHDLRTLLDVLPTQTDGLGPAHFIALPDCSPLERQQLARRGLRVITGETLALLEALGGEPKREELAGPANVTCPYPGLEAFSEDQAALFFGRHAEVSQAAALLGGLGDVDQRWLAIEGPSGVGKSSFARAGVIPALRRGFAADTPARWRVAVARPGAAPFESLAVALHAALELDVNPGALAQQLREDPRRLTELTRERVGPGEGLLILLDQLEELVTLAPPALRPRFGECIAAALDARAIYLITTVRSDLVPALQRDLPALASQLNDVAQRYALPPISRAGLREAICEPAALMGIRIAPELVERILVDVDAGQRAVSDGDPTQARTGAAALPLVAHVLRGLWTPEHVEDGLIALDEYLALGGIAGALSRSADKLIESLNPSERELARALLLRLVRLVPDGTATRRVITLSEARELANDRVLDRLSGGDPNADGPSARLLLIRDGQAPGVELVHEALIFDWAALRGWIAEHRELLLLDEELARATDKWEARGCPDDELPTGRDVVELLGARPQGAGRERQRGFQAALRRAQVRRKWARIGGVAALVVAIVGVTGLILYMRELASQPVDASAARASDSQAPDRTVTAGPPTLNPKYEQLLSCWFEHPRKDLFSPDGPVIELHQDSYGSFIGGINSLLYNGRQIEDRQSTSLTLCAERISLKTLRKIDDLSALELLAGVPATVQHHEDFDFAAVNPAFIHWARRELLLAPDQQIDGVSVQIAYDRVFQRLFRLMGESALLLHEQHDPAARAQEYMQAVAAGEDGFAWLDRNHGLALPDYAHPDFHAWKPSHAIGFWLRRQLDSSLGDCWHAVRELLARYDGEWLAAQQARYPKGWTKLAALPDRAAAN